MMLMSSFGSIGVLAAEVDKSLKKQDRYSEYNLDILSNQEICYKLNGEIEVLTVEIEENRNNINETNEEIEGTSNEINKLQNTLKEKEAQLQNKITTVYSVGGASAYWNGILNGGNEVGTITIGLSNSNMLLEEDKEVVDELLFKKRELDKKIQELNNKKQALEKIVYENEKKYKEVDKKKKKHEVVVDKLIKDREEYDANYLAKEEEKIVLYYFGVIDLPASSYEEISNSIKFLEKLNNDQLQSGIVRERVQNYIEYGKLRLVEMDNDKKVVVEKSKMSGSYLVEKAMEFIGTPYKWGANGPEEFDCSGFTKYIYQNYANITLSRTTYTQVKEGTVVEFDELEPGDLVFTYNGDHVGIYVGGGNYINATQPGDTVRVTKIEKFYAGRRILEE